MKKESTSRRKKLPLLLGALLIISVAAYGTRAYFSDSAKMQGDIALSLGDVDIIASNNDWTYVPTNGNNVNLEVNGEIVTSETKLDKKTVENVRPGDAFTKTYTIENTGKLDANVNLDISNFEGTSIPPHGPVTITVEKLEKNFELKSGDNRKFVVTLTIAENLGDAFNKGNEEEYVETNKTAVDYLQSVITVTGQQTNANTNIKE